MVSPLPQSYLLGCSSDPVPLWFAEKNLRFATISVSWACSDAFWSFEKLLFLAVAKSMYFSPLVAAYCLFTPSCPKSWKLVYSTPVC